LSDPAEFYSRYERRYDSGSYVVDLTCTRIGSDYNFVNYSFLFKDQDGNGFSLQAAIGIKSVEYNSPPANSDSVFDTPRGQGSLYISTKMFSEVAYSIFFCRYSPNPDDLKDENLYGFWNNSIEPI
jgi:hypothetical protein